MAVELHQPWPRARAAPPATPYSTPAPSTFGTTTTPVTPGNLRPTTADTPQFAMYMVNYFRSGRRVALKR